MGQLTKIQWCDHTFNPWRGCTKVSPGCAHCYAETLSHRNPKVLGEWGPNGTRIIASESMWRQPSKWNAEAAQAGERRLVFCASLADVFEDRAELEAPRLRLYETINATPSLDWLLLTKRPENIVPMQERMRSQHLVASDHFPWPNIWYGASVEDQQRANERIPHLLRVPAQVRFLSVEPLLGPISLRRWLSPCGCDGRCDFEMPCPMEHICPRLDWIIIGGESGPQARTCMVKWIDSLLCQCMEGPAVYVKQLGSQSISRQGLTNEGRPGHLLRDPKGGEPEEWPAHLRVREFPQ